MSDCTTLIENPNYDDQHERWEAEDGLNQGLDEPSTHIEVKGKCVPLEREGGKKRHTKRRRPTKKRRLTKKRRPTKRRTPTKRRHTKRRAGKSSRTR